MGPQLDDPKLFECRQAVPLLDTHSRRGRDVDEAKLRLVAANSNSRAQAGDPALLFIGHTDDLKPETDQPPLVGYVRNFAMGQHEGRPCVLADLYYKRDTAAEAFAFPRRSVEVYYSEADPKSNYIDAVALLKRSSERALGLVAYSAQGRTKERYSMADSNPSGLTMSEADIPALMAFMDRKGIKDMAEGIRQYLLAKADGTDKPGDDEITQADLPKLDKFMKQQKIDPRTGYNEGLARYKKARREGTLERY